MSELKEGWCDDHGAFDAVEGCQACSDNCAHPEHKKHPACTCTLDGDGKCAVHPCKHTVTVMRDGVEKCASCGAQKRMGVDSLARAPKTPEVVSWTKADITQLVKNHFLSMTLEMELPAGVHMFEIPRIRAAARALRKYIEEWKG